MRGTAAAAESPEGARRIYPASDLPRLAPVVADDGPYAVAALELITEYSRVRAWLNLHGRFP